MFNSRLFSLNSYAANLTFMVLVLTLTACSPSPTPKSEYLQTDQYISTIKSNLQKHEQLQYEVSVDHSRLAGESGQPFPPSQVIVFRNKQLEAKLLSINPMIALDLPFKILAFKQDDENKNRIVWNDLDFLALRYVFNVSKALRSDFQNMITQVTSGIEAKAIYRFKQDSMPNNGIVTLTSPYDFDTSYELGKKIILANDDVTIFDTIDFQVSAKEKGVNIPRSTLIMFGAPSPGGKAMRNAPTLGVDAFPQKFLVWNDAAGKTHVSYNHLSTLADRQGVSKAIALYVIQYRLNSSFEKGFNVK
jgi:uncharacterized protein (DUF302 family)